MASLSEQRFVELFASEFELTGPPALESRLVEDLGFDSLSLAELWIALEDLADREIDPSMTQELATVGDVYRFVDQQLVLEP